MKLEMIMEEIVEQEVGILIFGERVFRAIIFLPVEKIYCMMSTGIRKTKGIILFIFMCLLEGFFRLFRYFWLYC